MLRNKMEKIMEFDHSVLENVHINLKSLDDSLSEIKSRGEVNSVNNKTAWALKALTLTDLTTLAGDDTKSNVHQLCYTAAYPFPPNVIFKFSDEFKNQLHTASVCVYPSRVADAAEMLRQMGKLNDIGIAAVAAGFPSGQYSLKSRLDEIRFAVDCGATEIDIVVNRDLVLNNRWEDLYAELCEMRKACGSEVHLKTILAVGECGTMDNVYKASMVAMLAGSDFIKTSTGKETVNATLQNGLVMIRAIKDFYRLTGKKIGLKPAGGIKTVENAISWLRLIKETLGDDWLCPELFRFGASGLLDDIVKQVKKGC